MVLTYRVNFVDKNVGDKTVKFKTEISLIILSIVLYILSAFCYSYEAVTEGIAGTYYPYQDYAFPLIVVASLLLLIAAILYSKGQKQSNYR
ncbi:MAG: hypothetical protein QW468_02930 [Candidatus Bathyarchaeia archaeon]